MPVESRILPKPLLESMLNSNRSVAIWLIIVCLTVFSMVVVGGITRLTESGLSMVDWKPIIGIVPPLDEADWQRTFEAYKSFPQYQQININMDIEAFKGIFYWEYSHRVLGRLIGIIFFLPFVVFLLLGKLERPMIPKLWVGLALGGAQGVMGWYMVKSGLVDEPRVSHYRLAAHLSLALVILAFLSWLVLDLLAIKKVEVSSLFNKLILVLTPLLAVQIVYGAFVAGSRAGYGFNTFPLMNGELIPMVAFQLEPTWLNFLDNNAMLQFIHRWVGATVLTISWCLAFMSWRYDGLVKTITTLLALGLTGQFLLGVFTLINFVPITLASLHQAGACIVLVLLVGLVYVTRQVKVRPGEVTE